MVLMIVPEDLVFQILLWLPVASLLRFKSVCKCWFSIIESSNFINQHHLHMEEQNLLVVSHNWEIPSVGISFLSSSGNIFHVWENLDLPKSPLFCINEIGYGLKAIASYDGLICAETNFFSHIIVCNPAIKQLKRLPEMPFPKYTDDDPPRTNRPIVAGFGFDVKTNDYKVVIVVQELDDCEPVRNVTQTGVEVYSFSTDSWRIVADAVVPVVLLYSHCSINAPFRNGIFCWLGFLNTSEEIGTILLFDFSKEIFDIMPLPDAYRVLSNFTLRLALLRDNIACIEWEGLVPWEKCISYIWVLNEYGVKDSWTKLYTVQLEPCTKPIGVFMNGELIGEELDDLWQTTKLWLCDPVSQEVKRLPFEGPIWFNVVAYKESLVSIEKCKL